jgi:hypothetical protein
MTKRAVAAVVALAVIQPGPSALAQWRPGGQMRIILLIDSSNTIASMLPQFRSGLNAFLDDLPGEPEMALISTGGQLRIRQAPTSDREKVRAAANSFTSDGGGNAFLDSLLEADKRFLKSTPDRRPVFVILATDPGGTMGELRTDPFNKFVKDFVARGGRAHALIVQGVSTGVTSRLAENLTGNTGGFFETIGIANAIPKVMKSMALYVAADQ